MHVRHLRLALAASVALAAACGGKSTGRDHGAPSATYPAPHTALPQVINAGGPVQTAPVFVSVTWPGDSFAPFLDDFVSRLGTSQYWAEATSGYGIGLGTAGAPVHLTTPAPPMIVDTALEAWLVSMLDGSHPEFGTPTENTQYLLFTPADMVITGGGDTSCVTYAGYHAFVTTTSGLHVPYDLIPRCGGYGTLSDLDELTDAAGHEMIEAASDPQVLANPAWDDTAPADATWDLVSYGGELGDMCEWQEAIDVRPPDLPYVIQRSWSNVAAAASHDPCVPGRGDVYFNAAPVLVDDVTITPLDLAPETGKGIRLVIGQSKTIEVDIFSDGPTRPLALSAIDESTMLGSSPELAFHFDRGSGVNGERSYLTVTALRAPVVETGFSLFFIETSLDGRTEYWPVYVED